MIDALSDYDFYDKGLVEYPIPANNHMEPFLENNVPNLWTYYCCVQYRDVANRFFVFPSVRNRVLGLQLYKFQIAGFLHWGYNFWYSQYSKKAIDPFRVTDAGQGFPSGDAFLVYPGEQGPVESLRLEVFYEAIQDLRALELLESQIGRDAVLLLLEECLEKPITFSDYPNDADWLLGKREQINRKIAESSSGVPYICLGFTIPFIDLSTEKEKQVLTDREPGQYLGQPDSVLLNDGTIYTVYPKGQGIGQLILKKSSDGGLTWSERLSTTASWATSQETPTVYKIEKPDGKIRLELICGLVTDGNVGFQTAYSEDNGATWSELKPYFQDQGKAGIVALASLTRLKNPDDSWAYRWMGIFHDFSYNNWKTYLTFDANGNEQWSTPVRLLAEHDVIEKYAGLCEIEVIRSPDGKQLALLAWAQFKKTNAMITFSNDEGNTWTETKEMQGALMGERHKAEYDPVSGRLLITFREIIRRSATNLDDWVAGDWVAWVGTYDDLVHFREGQYRVRLMEDYTPSVRSGDTGYAGNVVLADGTYVLTSYGYFDPQDTRAPYIMTVRVKLSELDQRMNN
nr:glycoside hydrolase domain-containing protein [Paenibacillus alginolyticus]